MLVIICRHIFAIRASFVSILKSLQVLHTYFVMMPDSGDLTSAPDIVPDASIPRPSKRDARAGMMRMLGPNVFTGSGSGVVPNVAVVTASAGEPAPKMRGPGKTSKPVAKRHISC